MQFYYTTTIYFVEFSVCIIGVHEGGQTPQSCHQADLEDEYRIEGIFRGYKCSWFSRIRHEPRTFITANLIFHACMLQKRRCSMKIKSATIYTLEIPARYGIYQQGEGGYPLAPIPPPKICIQVLVGVHSWTLYIY